MSDSPWRSPSDRWPVDQFLRQHGYRVAARPPGKPVVWLPPQRRIEAVTEDLALFTCLEPLELFALVLADDGQLHIYRADTGPDAEDMEIGHGTAAAEALVKLREKRRQHPEVAEK